MGVVVECHRCGRLLAGPFTGPDYKGLKEAQSLRCKRCTGDSWMGYVLLILAFSLVFLRGCGG